MELTPLSESPDYRFPEGVFDVRGWQVNTMVDEERVGAVVDLLVDEEGRVRHLVVDLDFIDRSVLLPVESTRVDEADNTVWLPRRTRADLESQATGDGTQAWDGGERPAGPEGPGGESRHRRKAKPVLSRSARPRRPLKALGAMDRFTVVTGDPDPRGWPVLASDGRLVGSVSDLLVDRDIHKVRYLECELDAGDRHVLIPIGYARLDEGGERVLVDAIGSREMQRLPPFLGLPMKAEYEDELITLYRRGFQAQGYGSGSGKDRSEGAGIARQWD